MTEEVAFSGNGGSDSRGPPQDEGWQVDSQLQSTLRFLLPHAPIIEPIIDRAQEFASSLGHPLIDTHHVYASAIFLFSDHPIVAAVLGEREPAEFHVALSQLVKTMPKCPSLDLTPNLVRALYAVDSDALLFGEQFDFTHLVIGFLARPIGIVYWVYTQVWQTDPRKTLQTAIEIVHARSSEAEHYYLCLYDLYAKLQRMRIKKLTLPPEIRLD